MPSPELVSPPEPTVEWTTTADGDATLQVVGDTAFVAGRSLHALDPGDGSERWRVGGESRVRPEAVGDGAVFVDRDGDLQAHAAATGEYRWTLDGARSATYHDGAVFAVADDRLHALDAARGSERWTVDLDLTSLGSPAVADGTVYVGDRGRFHAVDAATGEVRWTVAGENDGFVRPGLVRLEPAAGPSPTVGGVVPVWFTETGALLGVAAADGTERWRVERVPETNSPPVARHGDSLVVASDGSLTAYDAATGAERWRVETGGGAGRPRVAGDAVYVSDADTVHSVDAATGARRWRSRLDSERPVHLGEVADGTVSISSWDGWVAALDAADGALGWRHRHGGEPAWFPAVADGTVYLGTRDGRAMALSEPDSPGSPLRRLTPSALAGGLGVAGALAATGYHRLRSRPDAHR